eukprot:759266-Hanusia_phi.AAC.1
MLPAVSEGQRGRGRGRGRGSGAGAEMSSAHRRLGCRTGCCSFSPRETFTTISLPASPALV